METHKKQIYHRPERVSSTYAEIYLDDDYCDYIKPLKVELESSDVDKYDEDADLEWVSPSDLLIGKVDLKPPFTSKITRGKTHEGILSIGDGVLQKERAKFLEQLKGLLSDNDSGWGLVLRSELKIVRQKLKAIYDKIFETKSKIMAKEITDFYEKTLQELEDHMRSELKTVLVSARANAISDLNTEISHKLAKEKIVLENVLQKKYDGEVSKIKKYYELLFDNEVQRCNKLINQAVYERNDALAAFLRQIEAENITSTMYVMCTESRKCKIKQFILDNYQTTDISEKMQKIKDRQELLDNYKKREVHITQINREWEEKIKKILQLFLKFISFSLKLLPEQTTFLLDLEKMIVLQMNEIIKQPEKCPPILVEEEHFKNIFKFEEIKPVKQQCEDDPFYIVGDLTDLPPTKYGSRETLPDDVDLPFVRVDRQFLFAKCHGYEKIKEFLESQRCKCNDFPASPVSDFSPIIEGPSPTPSPSPASLTPKESASSDEPLLLEDMKRFQDCPARSCQNWIQRNTFPYLNSYLDFTEENFERVKTILGKLEKMKNPPDLIDPAKYANAELPFAATKELYHDIETQYSSQEEIYVPEFGCTCLANEAGNKSDLRGAPKESMSREINKILQKHKASLRFMLQNNPELLKMFTDECFDFRL